jgi:hypothetical protein
MELAACAVANIAADGVEPLCRRERDDSRRRRIRLRRCLGSGRDIDHRAFNVIGARPPPLIPAYTRHAKFLEESEMFGELTLVHNRTQAYHSNAMRSSPTLRCA